MGVRNRLVDRLAARTDSTAIECPVCGVRYEGEPLNCAACGNTRFE